MTAVGSIRRSTEFLGLRALMALLTLGLYTVMLTIIPLLMEKGADHTVAALGLGLVGAGQVGGRLPFAAIPATARIVIISGTATRDVLLLALLPGPVPLVIAAGMLAGAGRGCRPPSSPTAGAGSVSAPCRASSPRPRCSGAGAVAFLGARNGQRRRC